MFFFSRILKRSFSFLDSTFWFAMAYDEPGSTYPTRQDVYAPEEILAMFDFATYEKVSNDKLKWKSSLTPLKSKHQEQFQAWN